MTCVVIKVRKHVIVRKLERRQVNQHAPLNVEQLRASTLKNYQQPQRSCEAEPSERYVLNCNAMNLD
jgi:hypothetical protein